MRTIPIPDDLLPEVEELMQSIDSARSGLDHFSTSLKAIRDRMWRTINEAIPETKGLVLRLDMKKKELVVLYKKEDM